MRQGLLGLEIIQDRQSVIICKLASKIVHLSASRISIVRSISNFEKWIRSERKEIINWRSKLDWTKEEEENFLNKQLVKLNLIEFNRRRNNRSSKRVRLLRDEEWNEIVN